MKKMLAQFFSVCIIFFACKTHARKSPSFEEIIDSGMNQLTVIETSLNNITRNVEIQLNKDVEYITTTINETKGINVSECLMGWNPSRDQQFWSLLKNRTGCLLNQVNSKIDVMKNEIREVKVNLTETKKNAPNCYENSTSKVILCQNQVPDNGEKILKPARELQRKILRRIQRITLDSFSCDGNEHVLSFTNILSCLKKLTINIQRASPILKQLILSTEDQDRND